MASEKYEAWPQRVVQMVADVLADTDTGLTGTQIGDVLQTCGLGDDDPGTAAGAKRRRLFFALWRYQERTSASNAAVRFITEVMHPPTGKPALWAQRRGGLNEALVYVGLTVRNDGRIGRGERARTFVDAARLSDSVRADAERRGCHERALASCAPEAVQRNWFHAALEAVKGLLDYLREATGLTGDGIPLIDKAMGGKEPLLRINGLATESERNEQTGLADIVRGIVKMYRHPTAHDSARQRTVTRGDFLDLLTLLSVVYRRLEGGQR